MAKQILTHLMFYGNAEEAMNFYVSLFPDSAVKAMQHYDDGDHVGTVLQARFTLAGRDFICIDSPVNHGFEFSPAMSIFVECDSAEELDRVFAALAEGGEVFMPLDNYGFSQRFGWAKDRFGVSWQLNLA